MKVQQPSLSAYSYILLQTRFFLLLHLWFIIAEAILVLVNMRVAGRASVECEVALVSECRQPLKGLSRAV